MLQALVMFAGGAALFIRAVIVIGGFDKMVNALERGQRMTAFR